jgi:hypothetical protein
MVVVIGAHCGCNGSDVIHDAPWQAGGFRSLGATLATLAGLAGREQGVGGGRANWVGRCECQCHSVPAGQRARGLSRAHGQPAQAYRRNPAASTEFFRWGLPASRRGRQGFAVSSERTCPRGRPFLSHPGAIRTCRCTLQRAPQHSSSLCPQRQPPTAYRRLPTACIPPSAYCCCISPVASCILHSAFCNLQSAPCTLHRRFYSSLLLAAVLCPRVRIRLTPTTPAP